MANSKKLLHNGLNEQAGVSGDPKKYGMDNMSDKKNQKPLPTPRQKVAEKGKNFTICLLTIRRLTPPDAALECKMGRVLGIPIDLEYEPLNEKSKSLGHNATKSDLERGFIKDELGDFYAPGSSERRDKYGNVVSHQDSSSFPTKRGLNY